MLRLTYSRLHLYSIAVSAVALLLLLMLLLEPLIPMKCSALRLCFATVIVSAWHGSLGLGLLATALASLVCAYFFLRLQQSEENPIRMEVAERQQAEEELREKSLALENAMEGISRLDAQGRYITVNRAYANMVGYRPEEMLGMEWQLTVYPEDRAKMMAVYQFMLTNGKVETEVRGIQKDGSIFYKELTIISAYDNRQVFTGHYCFMKNITSRKRSVSTLSVP